MNLYHLINSISLFIIILKLIIYFRINIYKKIICFLSNADLETLISGPSVRSGGPDFASTRQMQGLLTCQIFIYLGHSVYLYIYFIKRSQLGNLLFIYQLSRYNFFIIFKILKIIIIFYWIKIITRVFFTYNGTYKKFSFFICQLSL